MKKTIFFSCLLVFIISSYIVYIAVYSQFYRNTDFLQFYQSVRFYFAGQSLYSPICVQSHVHDHWKTICSNGNLNPPFLTFLLLPFYFFGYCQSMMIFDLSSLIIVALSLRLLFREFTFNPQQQLLISVLFFAYVPILINLFLVQVAAWILLLTILLWSATRCQQWLLAGIWLGLLCSIKLFYGLFFIYFLLLRQWRLLWTAGIVYVVIFLAMGWWFGFENYQQYQRLLHLINWYGDTWNSSFLGVFTRYFSNHEHNVALINLYYLVQPLTTLATTLTLGYFLQQCQKIYRAGNSIALNDLGFSLTLIVMLLISPLGWLYYFDILLIPVLVLFKQSANHSQRDLIQLTALTAIFLSMLAGKIIYASKIHAVNQILLNGGWGIYSLLLLGGLLTYLLQKSLSQSYAMPKVNISPPLWPIIYWLTFSPAIVLIVNTWHNALKLMAHNPQYY